MSTTTSVGTFVKIEIFPPAPTGAMADVTIVCPFPNSTFDTTGRVDPVAHTVKYPAADGFTASTWISTADAVAGTPVEPPTTTASTDPPPATGVGRVSNTRTGVTDWNDWLCVNVPDSSTKNPTTSVVMPVVPAKLNTEIDPDASTGTLTRFVLV